MQVSYFATNVFVASVLVSVLPASDQGGPTLLVPSQHATIQAAISAAPSVATILVDGGSYYETINLLGKDLQVVGIAGPSLTVLDSSGANDSCVTANSGETLAASIEGFTLTGGAGKPFPSSYGFDHYGGGVFVGDDSSLRIKNCWIVDNGIGTGTFAGGVFAGGAGSHAEVSGCLILGNHAWASGGATLVDGNATMHLDRCTIYGNTANSWAFGHQGGVSMANGGDVTLADCVVWGNAGYQIEAFGGIYSNGTSASCSYSCVEGGFAGVGNLASTPSFVDIANRDFHLQLGSACIDAGDPASVLDPDGTRADMGCFFFDQGPPIIALSTPYGTGCGALVQAAWTPLTTGSAPSPRNSPAECYDSLNNEWLIFGGNNNGVALGDTWRFDGTTWQQLAPANEPSARRGSPMVFDEARGRAVLFGGFNQTSFQQDETWEWDGTDWLLATPTNSPSKRMSSGMCYDAGRQCIVLFGGLGTGSVFLDDTWEYDGTDWTLVASTGPAARSNCVLAYDPVRGESVLYGGRNATGSYSDTWVWDGATWTQRTTTAAPAGQLQPALEFDPIRGKLLLFGGASFGYTTNYSDTWEWDGSDWAMASSGAAPSQRHGAVMAWDEAASRMLMFGGRGLFFSNDTWELSVSGGSAPLQMTPQAAPILGTNGSAVISNAPYPLGGVSVGFSDTLLTGLPILPLSLDILGMQGCQLLHSNDVFGLTTTAGAPGTLDFSFGIPGDLNLLGAHVYLQAYCFAPGANALELIASNGIDWTLGNQ